jgi:hypothetical protein
VLERISNEGYSRNASCTLHWISTLLLHGIQVISTLLLHGIQVISTSLLHGIQVISTLLLHGIQVKSGSQKENAFSLFQ